MPDAAPIAVDLGTGSGALALAMATEVPLQPGEQTVGFTVTAVWELT